MSKRESNQGESDKVHSKIRTKSLDIVDDEERVRINFQVDNDQGTYANFFDLNGTIKMGMGITPDGSVMIIMAPDGTGRLSIASMGDGSSRIAMFSGPNGDRKSAGEPAALSLYADPGFADAGLVFYNQKGIALAHMGSKKTEGEIVLSNGKKAIFKAPK